MDRSLYPTKVEVRTGDFAFTEAMRAFHITTRQMAFSEPGVVVGLEVQQSAVSLTRFDLVAGYGFASGGELCELTSTLEGQSLGTVATQVWILVGLMYQEASTKPGASETDGVARARRAARTAALRVYTAEAYDALPATYPTDLSVDAKDRFLVCGIARLPADPSDPLDIVLPPSFDAIKSVTQTRNITGVVITGISTGTRLSDPFPVPGTSDTAALIFQPSTSLLAYKAPFDATVSVTAAPFDPAGTGATVDVSNGGTYTLTSGNGVDTLTVDVDPLLAPSVSSASVTDALTVSLLYGPVAARGSAKDDAHRHSIGDQVPSFANPHGLRFANIETVLESLRGTLQLGTGYTTTTAQAEVPALLIPANTTVDDATGSVRYQEIAQFRGSYNASSPSNIRIYRSGRDSMTIAVNCRFRNSGTTGVIERLVANGDNPDEIATAYEFGPTLNTMWVQPTSSPDSWTFVTWARTQYSHVSISNQSLFWSDVFHRRTTTYGEDLLATAAALEQPRQTANFGTAGQRTLIFQSDLVGAIGTTTLRIWRSQTGTAPYSEDAPYEFTLNADWNNATSRWVPEVPASASVIYSFSKGFLLIGRRQPNGANVAAFQDTYATLPSTDGWNAPQIGFDLSRGALGLTTVEASGPVVAQYFEATGGNYVYTTPLVRKLSLSAADAVIGAEAAYVVPIPDPISSPGRAYISIAPSGTPSRVIYPVRLQQGAVITAATIYTDDVDEVGTAFVATFARQAHAGASNADSLQSAVTNITTVAGPATFAMTLDAAAGVRTVDNDTYIYFLQITGVGGAGYAHVSNIEITYTVALVTT